MCVGVHVRVRVCVRVCMGLRVRVCVGVHVHVRAHIRVYWPFIKSDSENHKVAIFSRQGVIPCLRAMVRIYKPELLFHRWSLHIVSWHENKSSTDHNLNP